MTSAVINITPGFHIFTFPIHILQNIGLIRFLGPKIALKRYTVNALRHLK
jgi:hypothetical protein